MTETEPTTEITHGTLTAYTKNACRCDPCRLNWNRYQREHRRSKRNEGRVHTCPSCTCEPSYEREQ